MDIILVSSRSGSPTPHWSRTAAATAAADLVGRGAAVHWLCPIGHDEAAPVPAPGVGLTPVVGEMPPFRSVSRRTTDNPLEVALAHLLRPRRRPIVAHLGLGAPGSVASLWVADRMGAKAVAVVRAAEVVCYRQDLLDGHGVACTRFGDPARCAVCCLATNAEPARPERPGLSPRQAVLARLLRPLGGLSGFPSAVQLLARNDLLVASLQVATVLTATAAERAQLLELGLAPQLVRALGEVALADELWLLRDGVR